MVKKEQKFGLWTVVSDTPIYHIGKRSVAYYQVQCQCGHIEEKNEHHLLDAAKTNSGCLYCRHERKRVIQIGDVYKGWKVVSYASERMHRCLVYNCECLNCHRIFKRTTNALKSRNTTFYCRDCANKLRGERKKLENGAIGDLTAEKIAKIRNNAKHRHIKFDLSISYLWGLYLKQNRKCAITGDPIPHINKASLDRIDSSEGYVEGNVQWTTAIANIAKQQLSMEELYELAKKIVNHYENLER